MTQYERELSNLSYTNKDFGNIYPELLDLVKKISYKWDPSESDESDPGVVLLKLAAILADKNNYNIDKNVLELFPLSVTQTANARQIFDQCGYSMKYMRGATTNVALVMQKEPEISDSSRDEMGIEADADLNAPENLRSYDIPMFTMVSDSDKSVVYTIVQHSQIHSDSDIGYFNAIQGTANQYSVNGETMITMAHLDHNNRIYFTESDIAENGIYINNVGEENWAEWLPVDNLVIQPLGTKCYKFGVENNGSRCYLEFPTDANYLINDGVNITYIRTSGRAGNIRKRVLNQFYVNPTTTRWKGLPTETTTEEVTLSADNVYITNHEAAVNGYDIETIEEAYNNYQRVKTTFDTIVTVKDYANYLVTSKCASNGFVCDRTNDIQSTYKVLYDGGVVSQTHTVVRETSKAVDVYADANLSTPHPNTSADGNSTIYYYTREPEMTAFDMRVYALEYRDAINTVDDFYATFRLVDYNNNSKMNELETALSRVKCVNHDFMKFSEDRVLLIKNKYPIQARIIPQYRLTDAQQNEIINKVTSKLYQILSSKEMSFGEEVPYDRVYDAIMGSDPRIRAVVLDDITYETYAVYYHNDGTANTPNYVFKELRIDDGSTPPTTPAENELWDSFRKDIFAKSVLAGVTPLFDKDGGFTYSSQQKTVSEHYNIERITTEAILETTQSASGNYASYTLQPNENVVMTAPNLVVDQEYSTYVKYIHNIENGIPANADYVLGDSEFIVFFWKTNDSDAYYQYIKYGSGSIISPTFQMSKQVSPPTIPALPPLPIATLANLQSGRGRTSDIGGVISGAVDDIDVQYSMTEYITKLAGTGNAQYVLAGNNTIYHKKVNKITLNGVVDGKHVKYPVCWVLNNSVVHNGREVYELFTLKEGVHREDLTYTYTLKNGEYLIYSNITRTQLLMLGAGTRIQCTGITSPLRCEIIDYNQFLSDGIEYLNDKWVSLPISTTLSATEMQYEQIGAGVTIRINTTSALTIKNDAVYVRGTSNKFNTGGVSIEYGSDSPYTSLPVRSDSIAWDIYSILNIGCSNEISQELGKNHSIKFGDTLISGLADNPTDSVHIISDKRLDVVGGIDVDVTSVNLSGGDPIPASLMVYTTDRSTHTSDTAVSYVDDTTVVTVNEDSQHIGNTFYSLTDCIGLPVGEYVMMVSSMPSKTTVATAVDGNFNITLTDDADNPLSSSNAEITYMGVSDGQSSNHNINGKYYFTISVKQQASFKMKISVSWFGADGEDNDGAGCAATITLSPMIRYNASIPFIDYSDDVLGFIEDILGKLDVNEEFNYLYSIPDDDLIENPLESSSFLKAAHIYNPYTICEWYPNSSGNDIRVTNKIKEGSYSV